MNESLRQLMHQQATSVAFKPSDLETIVHAGGRRVRRRRAMATLATLAAVTTVALAGGAVAVLTRPDSGPPAGPWAPDAVSWSVGTTIHVGPTDTVEAGQEVVAFVRTAAGFVALDDSDAVYSVTADGVDRLGQVTDSRPDNLDQQRLVVNAGGTLVGWVDESVSPGGLALHLYDLTSGTTRDFPATQDAQFFAIDGRTAYWRTDGKVYAVDIDTGERRVLLDRADLAIPDEIYSFEIYSVAQAVMAFSPNSDGTVLVGRRSIEDARRVHDFSKVRETSGLTDPVRLSPTGAWLSFGVYEALETGELEAPGNARVTPAVFDTVTGEQIKLKIPGDPAYAFPSVWLGDTTLQLWTWDGVQATFHRCTLPAASCVAVAGTGPNPPEVAVPSPDGRWYGPDR